MSELSHSLVERCRARVGTTLRGKWTLDGLIDVGGMAAVYAATHRNGNRVAIKMLHPEAILVEGVRQRLLKEGYVANQIGHSGAVRVLDDDETEDGVAFLVMELLEGETLQTRMDRHGGRLTVEDVLCITDKVLDILRAAHARDIFHRDIKPANIFITLGAEVKLLDFGIARARQMGEKTGGIHAPTMAGTVLGTPGYIPPEQAYGRVDELDARSDVWSVGATMFAALSGRCAHEATTINEQLILAATRPAPSLSTALPGAAQPLVTLVDRALAYRKEERWPSAAQMQQAVQDVFYQIEGFRISRDNHLAAVAAEIPALRPPAEASPDRTVRLDEIVPPRAAPTLIGHPLPPAAPIAPVAPLAAPQTQHGVVTPAPFASSPPAARGSSPGSKAVPILIALAALAVVVVVIGAALNMGPGGDAGAGEPTPAASRGGRPSPTEAPLQQLEPIPSPPVTESPVDPSRSADPAPSSTPRPAEPSSAAPPATNASTGAPPAATSSATAAPAASSQTGTLNINSIPVSKVILDGKPLGETPKVGIKVAPGVHQVTFVHPSLGRKTISVNVAAGETKPAATRFDPNGGGR